jgi:hypothetical protein
VTMDSACGHLSIHCISLAPIIAQFLSAPASVRSVVLHDATAR